MRYHHLAANFSRPNDNTAYSTGDIIANSLTGASVVPLSFTLPDSHRRTGRLTGARCVVTPASSSLVITALDFDLLVFRPQDNVPFAAANYPADNAALAITDVAFRELVGHFVFANGAWRNPAGALTAGVTGWQAVAPATRTVYPFSLNGLSGSSLVGVVQCKGAWTPTGIVNRFDFTLDLEQE